MKEINVNTSNGQFQSINGVLFSKNGTLLIQFPAGKSGDYVVPSSVTDIRSSAFIQCRGLKSVRIPSSVESIKSYAFRNCSSLSDVTYEGTIDPGNGSVGVFDGCDSLPFVCTSELFENRSFCSLTGLAHGEDECEAFHSMNNRCFEVIEKEEGILVGRKRSNATAWESHTTGCIEYLCVNESGRKVKGVCYSVEGDRKFCLNSQCMSMDELSSKIYVEIDLDNNTNVSVVDVDMNDLVANLSEITGIPLKELTIGIECNNELFVVRIIVVIDDWLNANVIAEKVDSLKDQGESCEQGVICRTRTTRIHVPTLFVSLSNPSHDFKYFWLLLAMNSLLLCCIL